MSECDSYEEVKGDLEWPDSLSSSKSEADSEWNFEDLGDLELGSEVYTLDDIIGQYVESQTKSNLDFERLDFATLFSKGESKIRKTYLHAKKTNVPRGIREYRDIVLNNYDSNKFVIYGEGPSVMLKTDNKVYEIGTNRSRNESFNIELKVSPYTLANVYSEEVAGKGSGLGFSSFVHLSAVLALSTNIPSITEPFEGNDITVLTDELDLNWELGSAAPTDKRGNCGLRIEITGTNYKIRRSNAHWVIDKYRFLSIVDEDREYIEMSNREEIKDTNYIKNTSLWEENSPYTQQFDKLHDLIPKVTLDQQKGLFEQFKYYYCNLKMEEEEQEKCDLEIMEQMIKGSKLKKNGLRYQHSPFRCLVREFKAIEDRKGVEVKCIQKDYSGKHTTFHTIENGTETISIVQSSAEFIPPPITGMKNLEDMFHERMMNYKIYQAMYIEEILYSKITRRYGYYYAETLGIGICWDQLSKGSMTWVCSFYSFEHPGSEIEVGQWHYNGKYYQSATFVVSRQDIQFSLCLRTRCLATYISVLNSASRTSWEYLEKSLLLIFGLWHGSSWMTSTIAGNGRFVTTGHLAGNDVSDLIKKAIDIIMPIRHCEYLYLQLVLCYLDNTPPDTLTPLLRLPLSFHSLEKDLVLGMNWHNRKCSHETECVTKMLKDNLLEVSERADVIKFYEYQAAMLEKMLNQGLSQDEFNSIMDSKPIRPATNVFFMIAMTHACKEDLIEFSNHQQNTGLSINDLVSDRGSYKFGVGGSIKDSKVVDELNLLVSKEKFSGPHDGLVKLLKGEKIKNIYLIRSKDGRGRREFATQSIKMRYIQNFKEKMASTVSNALPDDAFLNPEKYTEMVNNLSRILSSKDAQAASEDRSFHCGNLHPEGLSIQSLIIATVTNSNPMALHSALVRADTSRVAVMPMGYEGNMHEGTDYVMYNRENSQKIVKVPGVKFYYHKMQGMGAIFAGVSNTIQATGIMKACSEITKEIEDYYIITTQDDVGRAVQYKRGADKEFLSEFVMRKPLTLLGHSSQKNNWRKYVQVDNKGLVEVNNITTVSSGMVSQEMIHSTLVIKPLDGESPFEDLMNLVSNARQTIFWGDSPVLSIAALNGGVRLFQHKWLFTNNDINLLRSLKLIPYDIDELVSGFYPRDDQTLWNIYRCNNDSEQQEVLTGERSLYSGIVIRGKDKEKRDITPIPTNLFTTNLKISAVYKARDMGGRLKVNNMRPIPIKRRHDLRNRMMSLLITDINMDVTELEEVKKATARPKVTTIVRPMSIQDKKPKKLGVVRKKPTPDLKRVLGKRLLGINYRTFPSKEELELINMDEENFLNKVNEIKTRKNHEGFNVISPGGLPIVRFLGGTRYKTPHCFSFEVHLDEIGVDREKRFVYQGTEVQNFKPCLFGGAMKCKKCFGYGEVEGQYYAFYKRPKGQIKAFKIDVNQTTSSKDEFVCITKRDYSPIKDESFLNKRAIVSVIGDPVAVLNYGGYMHSNDYDAFEMYTEFYRKSGSDMPHFVRDFMENYPYFRPDREIINARCAQVVGNKCVSKIEVKGVGKVELDLSGINPVIIEDVILPDFG